MPLVLLLAPRRARPRGPGGPRRLGWPDLRLVEAQYHLPMLLFLAIALANPPERGRPPPAHTLAVEKPTCPDHRPWPVGLAWLAIAGAIGVSLRVRP